MATHIDTTTYAIVTTLVEDNRATPCIQVWSDLGGDIALYPLPHPDDPIPAIHLRAAQQHIQTYESPRSSHLIVSSVRLPWWRKGTESWVHVVGVLST